MRRWGWGVAVVPALVALGFACTGEDIGAGPSPGADAASSNDGSASDASPTVDVIIPDDGGCNATMPFVKLTSAGNEVNRNGVNETAPRLTPDELVMFVTDEDISVPYAYYVHRFERPSRAAVWKHIGPLFGDVIQQRRELWAAPDLKLMVWTQQNPDHGNKFNLVGASLLDDGGPNGIVFLPEFVGITNDLAPFLSSDAKELWFASDRPLGEGAEFNLQRSVRLDDGGFAPPAPISELNSTSNELAVVLSTDKRSVYFASSRGRTSGTSIWMATRPNPAATFGTPILVPGIAELQAAPISASPGWISPDDCRLYLSTSRDTAGNDHDVYVASRR